MIKFVPSFEGVEYSYSFDCDTGYFFLKKKNNFFVVLKGDDAFMFREHLELIMIIQDETINQRIERVIEIHYNFSTKPLPEPRFIET